MAPTRQKVKPKNKWRPHYSYATLISLKLAAHVFLPMVTEEEIRRVELF
jgi:hypothetical protein